MKLFKLVPQPPAYSLNGEEFKAIIWESNSTLADFARALDVSPQFLDQLCSGKRTCNQEMKNQIMQLLSDGGYLD